MIRQPDNKSTLRNQAISDRKENDYSIINGRCRIFLSMILKSLNFILLFIALSCYEKKSEKAKYNLDSYGSYIVVDLQPPYYISDLSSTPSDLLTNVEYKTTKIVMKRIPAGEFLMGDETGVGFWEELPVHSVKITNDFYIGIFEVTQRQWFEVMGTWPSIFTTDRDMLPVESTSWYDIKGPCRFIDSISSQTGISIDLPTEAEWEYCCKAGTSTNYSYGNIVDGNYMWYWDNSMGWYEEVGTKLPNPWGLYDMHGNGYEWCLDWFSAYYENTPSYYQVCYDAGTISDPVGPTRGTNKVIRGGRSSATQCRSADRGRGDPNEPDFSPGFRLVAVRRD
ncbi:MAG: formylglycine-generating enzyme family protein [Planctomycetota bacterium]